MKIRDAVLLSASRSTTSKSSFATSFFLLAILWTTIFAVPLAFAQVEPATPDCFSAERILVKPKSGADLTALHDALGTTVIRSYPTIGDLEVVQLPEGASVTNVLLQFQQSGLVQYAEPDYIIHALNTVPNDPLFSIPDNIPDKVDQWGMNNLGQDNGTAGADINAPEAWDIQ